MKEVSRRRCKLNNEQDTRLLGLEIANALEAGDIVALTGELGAGKTSLTKYIAEGLGVSEQIISPTFTIVRIYESGRIPLAHFDVYRLSGSEELRDIGADDIIGGRYASIVEWADIVADMLPSDTLLVHLTYGNSEGERIAEIV